MGGAGLDLLVGAHAISAGLTFRIAYAVHDLPQNALMFTSVAKAALVVGGLGLGVLDYRGGESDRLLLLMIGLPALGAIGCLGIALVWSRHSWRAPLPGSASACQGSSTL